MAKHNEFTTQNRYITEAVWIPSYLSIIVILLTYINNVNIQTLAIIISLISARIIFELVYRIIFGDKRLTFRIGVFAVAGQLIAWGVFFGFLDK